MYYDHIRLLQCLPGCITDGLFGSGKHALFVQGKTMQEGHGKGVLYFFDHHLIVVGLTAGAGLTPAPAVNPTMNCKSVSRDSTSLSGSANLCIASGNLVPIDDIPPGTEVL